MNTSDDDVNKISCCIEAIRIYSNKLIVFYAKTSLRYLFTKFEAKARLLPITIN